MTEEQKKILVVWLNDAHALEESLVKVLESQIKEVDDKPEAKARLTQHLEETKHHSQLVAICLQELDETPSTTKDSLSKLGAEFNNWTLAFTGDALVKAMHASYAAEHFEIATYTILKSAAEKLNQPSIVKACDEILQDEESMAAWIFDQLPNITEEHLTHSV